MRGVAVKEIARGMFIKPFILDVLDVEIAKAAKSKNKLPLTPEERDRIVSDGYAKLVNPQHDPPFMYGRISEVRRLHFFI